jgi:hypothetical protein
MVSAESELRQELLQRGDTASRSTPDMILPRRQQRPILSLRLPLSELVALDVTDSSFGEGGLEISVTS